MECNSDLVSRLVGPDEDPSEMTPEQLRELRPLLQRIACNESFICDGKLNINLVCAVRSTLGIPGVYGTILHCRLLRDLAEATFSVG